jgi:hypothetical protein
MGNKQWKPLPKITATPVRLEPETSESDPDSGQNELKTGPENQKPTDAHSENWQNLFETNLLQNCLRECKMGSSTKLVK